MNGNVLEIPLICDEICKYLSTKDLLTCRMLNSRWNSTIARIFKLRGAENGPIVNLTIENIETHLKFLDNKKPLEWTRSYQLEIEDCGIVISEESFVSFSENVVRLIEQHGQRFFSMHLNSPDMEIGTNFEDLTLTCRTLELSPLMNLKHLTISVRYGVFYVIKYWMPRMISLRSIRINFLGTISPFPAHLIFYAMMPKFPLLEKCIFNHPQCPLPHICICNRPNKRLYDEDAKKLQEMYPNLRIEFLKHESLHFL